MNSEHFYKGSVDTVTETRFIRVHKGSRLNEKSPHPRSLILNYPIEYAAVSMEG